MQYEGENSSISGEVYGPDEHGGDGGVYVYMNGLRQPTDRSGLERL